MSLPRQGRRADRRSRRRQRSPPTSGRALSAAAVEGNGWTDLHYTAALDWAALARALLAAGAPVDAPLRTDGEALGCSRRAGPRGRYPRCIGAASGDAAVAAAVLLSHGADVTARAGDGVTLPACGGEDAAGIVAVLLARAAAAGATDDDGAGSCPDAGSETVRRLTRDVDCGRLATDLRRSLAERGREVP